jgi:hypothetical protein
VKLIGFTAAVEYSLFIYVIAYIQWIDGKIVTAPYCLN